MVNSNIFLAIDADNAGRMVGRAVLADDAAALTAISHRIDVGQEAILLWIENNGGRKISAGGDECTAEVPASALNSIEEMRKDYEFATGLTVTVGVGATLSEAGKSLMAGKFRGKNQVVQYDPSVDQELAASMEHVAEGSGTEEEKKIGDAYLQAPATTGAEPHCEYCAEIEHEHSGDDCELCQEANAQQPDHDHTDNCQYCQEAAAPDHEHTDDCQYCAEAEAATATEPHCQYCAEVEHEHSGDDCQYCQEAAQANPSGNPLAAVAPVNNAMEGNVSRPEGYSDGADAPSDSGTPIGTGAPALHDVLQEGLDSQEDQIAKEKVMNMIGQALAGFKNQKHIFERAQQLAPEVYTSTIMMLKAMIEMGKMLGLEPKQAEAVAEQAPQQASPAQSGQPAAAQGDAAQAPQQ